MPTHTHIETIEIRELAQAITVDTDAVIAIQASDGYYKLELSHLVALVASDALSDLVLDQVDNTADIDKPLSTDMLLALGDKADLINGILAEAQRPNILSLHLSLANFPAVGTLKVLYIARDTGLLYYYSATDGEYVSLSGGGSAATTYEHIQTTPSTTWVVPHNLNRYPPTTVLSSAGEAIVGELTHDSKNQLTIVFSQPLTGTVGAG